MSDWETLKILSEDSRNWVSSRATLALQIAEQYQGGGLELEEYQTMMARIVDDRALDSDGSDLETKSQLVTAILGAAELI